MKNIQSFTLENIVKRLVLEKKKSILIKPDYEQENFVRVLDDWWDDQEFLFYWDTTKEDLKDQSLETKITIAELLGYKEV